MTTVGFVGLGSMGAALAGRLLQGNQVYGTNRTPAKANALIEQGLIWRDTPREVAAAAQVVFSMVTDDAALAAITHGQDGILAGLRPGTLYVEMSTVSPQASRELAGPEQAWFDVRLMHKDIRLALQAARQTNVPRPTASAADRELSLAEQMGYGHRDIAGIFQVLARTAAA